MDLSLSFYKVTKDTGVERFENEASGKMLTDITKALKTLNEEATIVEIQLPEQISEDTKERFEQVAKYFKAEAIKGRDKYVLCSYINTAEALYDTVMMFKYNDFFIPKFNEASTNIRNAAILATDIGREIIGFNSMIKEKE